MSADTWDFLGFRLAQCGIPSDVDEDVSGDYEFDPWRPRPNEEIVVVRLSKAEASKLCSLLPDPTALGGN